MLQFALHKLFFEESAENVVLNLLDAIGELCTETIDLNQWDVAVSQMIHAVTEFEGRFPKLMVSRFSINHFSLYSKYLPLCHYTYLQISC